MPRHLSLTEAHVARAFREVPDPGGFTGYTHLGDEGVARVAAELNAARPPGPLWVFAYGSLLWKPVFTPKRNLRAAAPGWHRQFCIEIDGFRGTPDAPGLMMALMSGGRCTGLAQQVDEAEVQTALEELVRREMPYEEMTDNARWIRLETAEGQITSLVFYAGPKGERIRRSLPLPVAARQMARACGHGGSTAEYLHKTLLSLEEHGIHDSNLWALQKLVADEIDGL